MSIRSLLAAAAIFASLIASLFAAPAHAQSDWPIRPVKLIVGFSAGDLIAKADPDGYTRWLQDITTHAIKANVYATRVWWARPGEIADYCHALPRGIIPGSAA